VAECRKLIVELLSRIGKEYVKRKKEGEFILDLMKIGVPNLLHMSTNNEGETAFIDMIYRFVRQNGLQKCLIEKILQIVVSLLLMNMLLAIRLVHR